jgi:hypothetical protein
MSDTLDTIFQVASLFVAGLGFILASIYISQALRTPTNGETEREDPRERRWWRRYWNERYSKALDAVVLFFAATIIVMFAELPALYDPRISYTFPALPINVSVRDFLAPNQNEPTGFGLYSYLLFGNRGDTNRTERLAATRAYLNQFDAFRTTRVRSAKDQLNVFYMPTIVDAEWIDQCDPAPYAPPDPTIGGSKPKPRWKCTFERQTREWNVDELAEWVELRYAYPRAAELLQVLHRAFHSEPDLDGIYVASYLTPLMSKVLPQPDPNILLLQRLSRVPPDHLETWVEELRIQFAKPQYWDVSTLRWIMLDIRSRFPGIAEKIDFIGPLLAKESKGQ